MKKLSLLIPVIALALWYLSTLKNNEQIKGKNIETAQNLEATPLDQNPAPAPARIPRKEDDFSEGFMVDYGKEGSPPQQDLHLVADLLQSYFSLVKLSDPLPLGGNREITTALIGDNPHLTRLLSPDSPWLSKNLELLDRWGTPLYFHPIDAKRIGIRSAGLDKRMWTSDDLTDGEDAKALSQ